MQRDNREQRIHRLPRYRLQPLRICHGQERQEHLRRYDLVPDNRLRGYPHERRHLRHRLQRTLHHQIGRQHHRQHHIRGRRRIHVPHRHLQLRDHHRRRVPRYDLRFQREIHKDHRQGPERNARRGRGDKRRMVHMHLQRGRDLQDRREHDGTRRAVRHGCRRIRHSHRLGDRSGCETPHKRDDWLIFVQRCRPHLSHPVHTLPAARLPVRGGQRVRQPHLLRPAHHTRGRLLRGDNRRR